MKYKSKAAFQHRFPDLNDVPLVEIPEDLVIDEVRATTLALVESYLKNPSRIILNEPYGEGLHSEICQNLKKDFFKSCHNFEIYPEKFTEQPTYKGGVLIIFGIGLGFNLDYLIEQTEADSIVMIEPDLHCLGISFGVFDWQSLFEHHERQGRHFTLMTGNEPRYLAGAILDHIALRGALFLDGTWLFVQPPFPLPLFAAIKNIIIENYKPLLIVQGNYIDECIMIRHSFENIRSHSFHLLEASRQPRRSEPVFIIGSGPSLDQDAAEIRRLRQKCIVFSCGSALQACLSHGIRPDFHVELENHELIYEILSHAAQTYDLSGLILIGSLTIDPKVLSIFDQSLLYFRHRTVPACLFGSQKYEMTFAAPTVTNVALRVAISLGFNQFYLFGTDLGTRRIDKIHAVDTAYRDIPVVGNVENAFDFSLDVPGNFGGKVKTDPLLFVPAQRNIETLIRVAGVEVWNCSDGVRIAGAKPLKAKGLRLPPLALPVSVIRDQLLSLYPLLAPGDGFRLIDPPHAMMQRARLFDDLSALIQRAEQDHFDPVRFWNETSLFRDANAYSGMTLLCSRELISAIRFAAFFIHRVNHPEIRVNLFVRFLSSLSLLLAAIREQSEDSFAPLISGSARP